MLSCVLCKNTIFSYFGFLKKNSDVSSTMRRWILLTRGNMLYIPSPSIVCEVKVKATLCDLAGCANLFIR